MGLRTSDFFGVLGTYVCFLEKEARSSDFIWAMCVLVMDPCTSDFFDVVCAVVMDARTSNVFKVMRNYVISLA